MIHSTAPTLPSLLGPDSPVPDDQSASVNVNCMVEVQPCLQDLPQTFIGDRNFSSKYLTMPD